MATRAGRRGTRAGRQPDTGPSKKRPARSAGRKAKNSPALRYLARGGFLARGVLYAIIGWIAVEVAFGHSSQQADKTGALHALGRNPAGEVVLWLLVVGFFGMALWWAAVAAVGPTDGSAKDEKQRKRVRLAAVGKAVVYAVLGWGVLEYAIGLGTPPSDDTESVDLTATLLRYPGGQVLVVVIGLVLAGGGVYLAYTAWREKFKETLELGQMSPAVRRAVEWLGRIGGIARGVVFVTAGIFLVVAAVDVQPGQAKGVDSALRALAQTPAGPWLLVLVAVGLIMFGLFSVAEARWRRV